MRVVGIKQLKAKLSEYLREVRRGEVFLVTDRDQVVAELRPPLKDVPIDSDPLDQAMRDLVSAGEVQPARAKREGWTWSPRGMALPPGTAAAVLDAVRADRGGSDE